MSATQADIVLFRNEIRTFSGQCLSATGVPIDITSTVFDSDAKAQAGDVTVIASATFVKEVASEGVFTMEWDGADFASFGSVLAETRLAYDLKIDDRIVAYGQIVLNPGVSS